MNYWSFLLQCGILLFIVGVFSLCVVMPYSLDAFSPMDKTKNTTQTPAKTQANNNPQTNVNAPVNKAQANNNPQTNVNAPVNKAPTTKERLTELGPEAVPIVSFNQLIDTMGMMGASWQKMAELRKNIQVEEQWIKYMDTTETSTASVNRLQGELDLVNASITDLQMKAGVAAKQTDVFRSRIRWVEEALTREKNTVTVAELRNRRSRLTQKLANSMKAESDIEQKLSPLMAQRDTLTSQLQRTQSELANSRAEYNAHQSLLNTHQETWNVAQVEHKALIAKTQKASRCVMLLANAQVAGQLFNALLGMTPENFMYLTNNNATRLSTLIQQFKQIDAAFVTLTSIPGVNNIIGTEDGTQQDQQQPTLNRLLIERMQKSKIVVPEKITRLPTNIMSINLTQIELMASQSEMLNKMDPMVIQTQLKNDVTVPILQVMVDMIPEKSIGAFYQQLCMFQNGVWHIRKNPLATKFDNIPIQPNLETTSIFAKSNLKTFVVK